jgi:HK97 family phage major capsid protein
MNLKEMKQKYQDLLAAASLAHDAAKSFLVDGKTEEANGKSAEAKEHLDAANSMKSMIEQEEQIVAVREDAKKSTKTPDVDRPIFDTDTDPEPDETKNVQQSIYVMRYGDMDEAVKVVAADMYGKDYVQKRDVQKGAFAKYVRHGDRALDANQMASLKTLILTPDIIKQDIALGNDVTGLMKSVKVQQEASLELGGVLVPEDFRLDLIKRLRGLTVMRGRARQVNTLRDAVEWPKIDSEDSRYTSQARVTWVDEVPDSAEQALTSIKFGNLRVPVHTVMARIDVSMNLLEDSGMNIISLISELFSEAMAIDEDEKFLIGLGAGTPMGILSNRDGSTYTPQTGVLEEVTGDANNLTADGLIDLAFALDSQYLANAIMVGTKNTFKQIRKLKTGDGEYLWERSLQRGLPPTVLGHDYFMSEALQQVLANQYPLLFMNPRGYLIADRVGMSIKRVEDTDTTGKNKVAIFARRRLGGQILTPWQFAAQKVATA